LQALASIASKKSGVVVHFLNHGSIRLEKGQSARKLMEKDHIAPGGATPLGAIMRRVLTAHEGKLCDEETHHVAEDCSAGTARCSNRQQPDPTLKEWGCPFHPPEDDPRRGRYVDGKRTQFCSVEHNGFDIVDRQKPRRGEEPDTPLTGVTKKLNMIVITDGEASDPNLVHVALQHFVHFCHVSLRSAPAFLTSVSRSKSIFAAIFFVFSFEVEKCDNSSCVHTWLTCHPAFLRRITQMLMVV
jgi:hypothetical protein